MKQPLSLFRDGMLRLFLLTSLLYFLFTSPITPQFAGWRYYSSNYVTVVRDAGMYIWSGGDGLCKYNKLTGERILYNKANSKLPDDRVTAIEIEQNGIVWVTTRKGVLKINGSHWDTLSLERPAAYESFNRVYDVAIGADNVKWFAADGGLIRYNDTTFFVYEPDSTPFTAFTAKSVAIDQSGHIWVASIFAKVYRYYDGNWIQFTMYNSGLHSSQITSLTIDQQNRKWFCSEDNGVAVFDDSTWRVFNTGNSGLQHNYVKGIAFDAQGTAWIGTYGGGLSKFDGANWTTYNTGNSGIKSAFVSSVNTDTNGMVWIGTEEGVESLSNSQWSHYPGGQNAYRGANFWALQIAPDQTIWIGDYNYGAHKSSVVKYDRTTWTTFDYHNSPIPFSSIRSIKFEDSNIVWILTTNCLLRYDGSTWSTFSSTNSGLPADKLYSLAIDAAGVKWIATDEGGLVKYDNITWTTYTTANSGLPTNRVSVVAIDHHNKLWVGTLGKGVGQFDGSTWTQHVTSGSILVLEVAPNNDIWADNDNGILAMRYDGTTWTKFYASNSGIREFDDICSFSFEDNIVWLGGSQGSLYRYDGSNWKRFDYKNSPLPEDGSNKCVVDSSGTKWITAWTGHLFSYNENPTSISEQLPLEYSLLQNYPNPFNPVTTIAFDLPFRGSVSLIVYNTLGEKVRVLADEFQDAGKHQISFNGSDLPSGVYFCRLQSGDYVRTIKMVLLR